MGSFSFNKENILYKEKRSGNPLRKNSVWTRAD